MIIKSKVIFTDEYKSGIMGCDVDLEEEIQFDLKDVSGLMPAESGTRTVIFLYGRDLLIKTPYQEILELWRQIKELNERIN